MQDFEIPRYNAALAAFDQAFNGGYAEGLKQLASGTERVAQPILEIDVPRNTVLDGEWHPAVPLFREAGRVAALAVRRVGTARLDASQATESSHLCFMENKFRWHVILNP